ncbi:MAG: magnesium transporter [Polyangiales bacterium]
MRLSNLIGPDLIETVRTEPALLEDALADFHAEDIAELVEDLDLQDAVAVLRALSDERGADVIERINNQRQVQMLTALNENRAASLLSEMDPDDRVDLLQELEEEDAKSLVLRLSELAPEAAVEVQKLVAYEPDSAGGLMTTEFIKLLPHTSIAHAMHEVRRVGRENEVETVYTIYVCDEYNKLLGVLSLRDLIMAEPEAELQDVMRTKIVHVLPTDDQERVAHEFAKYDFSTMPVTDELGHMLGVVTVDDVVDVVIDEATEDVQMMGGVVPLEDSYFQTTWFEFVWKRGIWLVILFFGQMVTASIVDHHESALQATGKLAIFIPLIMAVGGNAGGQSSSLIIRALAVGELTPRDWARVLSREIVIGLSLGLTLGLLGFARAWMTDSMIDPIYLAIMVGISIPVNVVISSMIGSLLPLLMRRAGIDPAVSSAPFIATLIDVIGLMIYFTVANFILARII